MDAGTSPLVDGYSVTEWAQFAKKKNAIATSVCRLNGELKQQLSALSSPAANTCGAHKVSCSTNAGVVYLAPDEDPLVHFDPWHDAKTRCTSTVGPELTRDTEVVDPWSGWGRRIIGYCSPDRVKSAAPEGQGPEKAGLKLHQVFRSPWASGDAPFVDGDGCLEDFSREAKNVQGDKFVKVSSMCGECPDVSADFENTITATEKSNASSTVSPEAFVQSMPVVLNAQAADEEESLGGCDAYVEKPDVTDFMQTLVEKIESSSSALAQLAFEGEQSNCFV